MNDLVLFDESDGLSKEQKRKLFKALGSRLQRGSPEHNLPRVGHIGSQKTNVTAKTDHDARLPVPEIPGGQGPAVRIALALPQARPGETAV
jgi:hypothetical protein